MEELRRNAMSSLGKHEEQSEYAEEEDYETDNTKTFLLPKEKSKKRNLVNSPNIWKKN